jgi:BirA family biotin operon repressor/biotin-[acetyl-CoA-carboxylase] ligase
MDVYEWALIAGYMPDHANRLRHVHIVDEISSTNDWVTQAMTEGWYPAICLAETQRSGRGRNGRGWFSARGESITLSMGRPFALSLQGLSGLSLVVGLVVARTLAGFAIPAMVKWPNDVLVHGKKIAGILVEIRQKASGNVLVTIGVGINYHVSESYFAQIEQAWTDMYSTCSGQLPSRNETVGCLLSNLMSACDLYEERGLSVFLDEWQKFDACTGHEVQVIENGRVIYATVLGVANDGALRVSISGEQRLLYAADVSIRVK